MVYMPSYKGELIDPAIQAQDEPMAAAVFEDITEDPKDVPKDAQVGVSEEVLVEEPLRPQNDAPIEFLDLDEIVPLRGSETSPEVTPIPDGSAGLVDDQPFEVLPGDEALDVPRTDSAAAPASDTRDTPGVPAPLEESAQSAGPASAPKKPSLAVRGVVEAANAPRRVAMQQAINSWTVASGVLKMIVMHPGYSSSLDDKLAGIEVTKHALEKAADRIIDRLGFARSEGGRQKVKRHVLPVLESVWGYIFSSGSQDMRIDQVVDFTASFLSDAADLLSADPDELFIRSDSQVDLAMARLTALTRIQCELQPIFDVLEKYTQKNATIGRIFFGDMTRRQVLDEIFRVVEARAKTFLAGIDLDSMSSREATIVNRVVLRQSVDLMSGILRSETAMAKLSSFARESPGKEGVLKDWIISQYDEWTDGMPTLAGMFSLYQNDDGPQDQRKSLAFK